MKQLLIACAMLAGIAPVKAQASSHGRWEENSDTRQHKPAGIRVNEFMETEMAVSKGTVIFSDVPVLKKPIYAIITNADGEYIKQARISQGQNTMSIRHLRRGLYFVTILYKNQSKKGFTLNL